MSLHGPFSHLCLYFLLFLMVFVYFSYRVAETEKQQDLPPGGQQSEIDVMSESFHSVTSPNSPSLNSFSKQPRGSLKKIFDK